MRSVLPYGSETWPVEEEDVIRLDRNDAKTVRWTLDLRMGYLHWNLGLD